MFKKTADLPSVKPKSTKKFKKIVITGGHHSSALPVIKKLREKYANIEVFWFGHKYSMKGDRNPTLEYREIESLNIPFFELHAGKFYKTYDVFRLLKIPIGFIQALYLLLKLKPDIVMSFGGYLAVPVVIAAKILGIPALTHEQTVVVGYANKLISKFADKVLISWESSKKYFKPGKVVLTGLPLREEVFVSNSDIFKINTVLPTVFVIAGKTGSHKINQVIEEGLKEILTKVNLIHQCGDHSVYKDFDVLSKKYDSIRDEVAGMFNLTKFVFSDSIGEAYKKADFIISRVGAHVAAEIIALQKPAILIPIPWVSHNEQYENAKIIQENIQAEV